MVYNTCVFVVLQVFGWCQFISELKYFPIIQGKYMEYNVTNDILLNIDSINDHYQLHMIYMITPFNLVIKEATRLLVAPH